MCKVAGSNDADQPDNVCNPIVVRGVKSHGRRKASEDFMEHGDQCDPGDRNFHLVDVPVVADHRHHAIGRTHDATDQRDHQPRNEFLTHLVLRTIG